MDFYYFTINFTECKRSHIRVLNARGSPAPCETIELLL